MSQSTFLHNTKISTSAINEIKALQKKRGKGHPKGRCISLMEMIQVMLNYPQIHTDMVFENIPTVPLEKWAGMECNTKRGELDRGCNDGDELISLSYIIRREKNFPPWRQHRNNELVMIQGTFDAPVSVDKVTKYSVRPPELRHVIRTLGHYYRWFFVKMKGLVEINWK